MVDAALATQAKAVADVSRSDRSTPIKPVRAVGRAEAFQRDLAAGQSGNSTVAGNELPLAVQEQDLTAGGGLLSTAVQLLLAETRTQEAGTSFIPSANVSRALDSYLNAQTQVQETIRESKVFGQAKQNVASPT